MAPSVYYNIFMVEKILKYVEEIPVTITGWGFGFIGILFVRFFFESLSSPTNSGIIPSDPYTLIHYGLFFLCLTLASSLVLGFFAKDYARAPKVLLFGLPLLWLAPLLDIIFSKGHGYKMLYIFDTGKSLLFDFLTFFGPSLTRGATYGMRIGIALSLLGLGYYIWLKTKNVARGAIGAFTLYILIFIVGSLPGVFYTLSHAGKTVQTPEVVAYFEKIITTSTISHNTLREGASSVTPARFIELGFDKLLSQILFILSFIFAGFLFWKIDSNKFWAVINNCRRERLSFYTLSLFCGIGFAYINKLGNTFVWADLLGIASLTIAWAGLWMHAVHVNDIIDLDIDKISNTERPLVKNDLDSNKMHDIGNVWLSVALLGAWSAGYYPFFMALVYVATSYIYSSPPLRLRKLPLVPSFLISTACLATILAGFFFVSANKNIQTFPILLGIGIIVMVTLAINFKDLKDVEGDRESGIVTLPILFGGNGTRVVGLFFATSIFLIPVFLSFYLLYIICLPASVIGYFLITKKPYSEKPIFVLRFFLLSGIALFYLLAFWTSVHL